MKKLVAILTLCLLCACCAFGFAACESENGKPYFGTYKDLNTGDKIIINDKGFIFGDVAYDYEVYDNYIRLTNYSGNTKKWYFHENCNVISPEVTFNFDTGYIPTRNGNFQATLSTLNNNLTATSVFYFALDGKYKLVFPSSPTLSEAGSYTLRNGLLTLTGNKQLSHQVTITRYYIDENYQIHVFAYINDINKFYNTENTDTPTEPTTPETHTHNFTDTVIEPTCTTGGYTLHECSCGEKYTDTYINALNHNYLSSIIAPTCTEQGYTAYMCTRCFDTYKENEIPALGHDFVENGLPVGYCALSSKQNYICTLCNKTDEQPVTGQAPDTHNHLSVGETCTYCGWSVYNKNGDSVLMKNSEDKLSAEFYGTETYDFGYLRKYYVNAYISNSVINIEENTFAGCESITNISIPNNVTSIGEYVFSHCSGLTSVIIGNNVTSIGKYAFQYCSSLTSITIPDSVTSIGEYAFQCCSSLTSVTIPDSVTSIGYWAFGECLNLIEVENGLAYVQNVLIGMANTNGLPPAQYSIRNGTRIIADHALSNNFKFLINITIPNSIISIGELAFNNCSSLTSITFNGTKAQWQAISKGSSWKYNVPSNCVVHCIDGDIKI